MYKLLIYLRLQSTRNSDDLFQDHPGQSRFVQASIQLPGCGLLSLSGEPPGRWLLINYRYVVIKRTILEGPS
jgi:hypothetical protein